jgi:uncharacterized protein (TIRG00374 family)
MNKKRILGTAIVLAVLCLLIYLQVHTWKKFDWSTFWNNTSHVNWGFVLLATAVTYSTYVLRATRWRIFLKPSCSTTTARLLGPQFIGFTGLALLGRPGEMIRPYLIARKENQTFSSQVAVWLVERIFDMGAVALMFGVAGFVGDPLWSALPNHNLASEVRWSAGLFLCGIVVLAAVAVVLRRSGYAIAAYLEKRFDGHKHKFAHCLSSKIVSFTDGLQVISDASSFLQLLSLSVAMWALIAVAYWLLTHAYGGELAQLGPASIMLLMVSAMFGSLIQLPGVGGGSQLATIAVMNKIFGVDNEVAVSCGMLIWVATFMSVIPMGLLLARREHLSLRAVAKAEEKAEAALAE